MSDCDRLIRFAAVAEELSFSKAAKRLRVDQPWLSRQVRRLEDQLGFPLFTRSTRAVALTAEGERLLPYAIELSRASGVCIQALHNLRREHDFELAVGSPPFTFWLPVRRQIFDLFRERFSRAELKTVTNYTPRLIAKLRNRIVDVIIVPQPFDCEDFEYLVIYEQPPTLLVPPEHPLAAQGSADIKDVAGLRIAVTDRKLNSGAYDARYGAFIGAGAIPEVVAEGATAISFYAREKRLALVSDGWPLSEPAPPSDFLPVKIAGQLPPIQYAFCRRKEDPRGVLQSFWNVARDVVAESGLAVPPQRSKVGRHAA